MYWPSQTLESISHRCFCVSWISSVEAVWFWLLKPWTSGPSDQSMLIFKILTAKPLAVCHRNIEGQRKGTGNVDA